jgi:hypothetical protein
MKPVTVTVVGVVTVMNTVAPVVVTFTRNAVVGVAVIEVVVGPTVIVVV